MLLLTHLVHQLSSISSWLSCKYSIECASYFCSCGTTDYVVFLKTLEFTKILWKHLCLLLGMFRFLNFRLWTKVTRETLSSRLFGIFACVLSLCDEEILPETFRRRAIEHSIKGNYDVSAFLTCFTFFYLSVTYQRSSSEIPAHGRIYTRTLCTGTIRE